jgi:hypothetical protein
MPHPSLNLLNTPRLERGTLMLALTGWMDGGMVSTGTVKQFMQGRDLSAVARVDPAGYYLDSFPGSMEIAALFRPHVKYNAGLVEQLDMPTNEVLADPAANVAFFLGKEPNINWTGFADCIFEITQTLGLERIIFMGSFGGTVPHTREPRMFGSVSHRTMLSTLKEYNLRPTDYEGPASFATYLLVRSPKHNVQMISIAAEIPGYLEGLNPLSIEAVVRRLAAIVNLPVDLAPLRAASTNWEIQVTEAVQKNEELAATVRRLEEEYDNELIDAEE